MNRVTTLVIASTGAQYTIHPEVEEVCTDKGEVGVSITIRATEEADSLGVIATGRIINIICKPTGICKMAVEAHTALEGTTGIKTAGIAQLMNTSINVLTEVFKNISCNKKKNV